ncbi:hypothetical protein WICMUC_001787 [Wickerhamomyces mucosus]|uniref:RNase III domain-containing protein n=1 Tax=Wickerhamomyces mucosus TaxID=1378264 RepID=A0A9P8TFQ4_9ASCO|nr:hypothetical protein WICMUC_001787 [Wickerhamomyces mucosus]
MEPSTPQNSWDKDDDKPEPQLPPIDDTQIWRLVFTKAKTNYDLNTNSRLAYIGHDILNQIVSTYTFNKFPHFNIDELQSMKEVIITNDNLIKWCETYNLLKILESISATKINKYKQSSTIVDLFEAYIGGVYINQGFPTVQKWIIGLLELIKDEAEFLMLNQESYSVIDEIKLAKEELYKIINPTFKPNYEVLEMTIPPSLPYFKVGCIVKDKIIGEGEGRNKKTASSKAAFQVLRKKSLKYEKNSNESIEKIIDLIEISPVFNKINHPKIVKPNNKTNHDQEK